MTDSIAEKSSPNDCADEIVKEEVEIRSECYEEVTIIITGKEAKLVLLKDLPTDSPAYNIKSENDDSEDSKHKYRPHCSELEKEKEGAETDGERLKNHSRKNLCEAKVPSEELEKLGDEVDFPDSVYKDELLKRNFEGPHEKLCEAKNSRLNEEGDAGSGIGTTFDRCKCSYVAKSDVKLRFRCGRCDFAAASRGALQRHISELHGLTERERRCELCVIPAHWKWIPAVHARSRDKCDKSKRFRCDRCEYSTHMSGHLIRHMRTHTNEKPYKCELCDFASAQSGNLKHHILAKHGHEIKNDVNS